MGKIHISLKRRSPIEVPYLLRRCMEDHLIYMVSIYLKNDIPEDWVERVLRQFSKMTQVSILTPTTCTNRIYCNVIYSTISSDAISRDKFARF